MTQTPETKHEKFLRLMQKRLCRTLDEMRLVSQLASSNYESFPEERTEAIEHLISGVAAAATAFDVPFAASTEAPDQKAVPEVAALSQARIRQVIEHLDFGGISEALEILRKALPTR